MKSFFFVDLANIQVFLDCVPGSPSSYCSDKEDTKSFNDTFNRYGSEYDSLEFIDSHVHTQLVLSGFLFKVGIFRRCVFRTSIFQKKRKNFSAIVTKEENMC